MQMYFQKEVRPLVPQHLQIGNDQRQALISGLQQNF